MCVGGHRAASSGAAGYERERSRGGPGAGVRRTCAKGRGAAGRSARGSGGGDGMAAAAFVAAGAQRLLLLYCCRGNTGRARPGAWTAPLPNRRPLQPLPSRTDRGWAMGRGMGKGRMGGGWEGRGRGSGGVMISSRDSEDPGESATSSSGDQELCCGDFQRSSLAGRQSGRPHSPSRRRPQPLPRSRVRGW